MVLANLQHIPILPKLVRHGRQIRTRVTDRMLGIETDRDQFQVKAEISRFNDHREYEAMYYPCIRVLLRALEIRPEDVVYDIGCGKGRVLCVAARLGVRKCFGIEVCESLVQAAKANAMSLRPPKAPIVIHQSDASDADYSEGTVYCLFNSFGPKTLKTVLQRIRCSVEEQPRRIRIGYACPDYEQVLKSACWLRQYGELRFLTHRYRVSLWESHDPWDSSLHFG
jgi:precorrin-6B methylase 2